MTKLTEAKEVNDGIFIVEVYKENKDDFEALARKGIPKIMCDFTMF
jgi:hypothetical protein